MRTRINSQPRFGKTHRLKLSSLAVTIVLLVVSASHAGGKIADFDLSKVIGTEKANCKQCHPSEVAQWEKTAHFRSVDRLKYIGNSKKYADALGISSDKLMGNSVCADCHGTKAKRGEIVEVISGVSCESCHGPSKDWLKPHAEYFEGMGFKDLAQLRSDREKETPAHRKARHQLVDDAGMIRPAHLHSLASNCLDCHIVGNEKLIAAGHKAASTFNLVSWTGGEVRHNFFENKDENAKSPSSLLHSRQRTAAQHDRLKLAIGALTQIEVLLQRRSQFKRAPIILQVGGLVAAGNGQLARINAASPIPEALQATGIVAPKLGLLFAPMPNDKETYGKASAEISKLAKKLADTQDGSNLQGLDTLVKEVTPHFWAHYKKTYLDR